MAAFWQKSKALFQNMEIKLTWRGRRRSSLDLSQLFTTLLYFFIIGHLSALGLCRAPLSLSRVRTWCGARHWPDLARLCHNANDGTEPTPTILLHNIYIYTHLKGSIQWHANFTHFSSKPFLHNLQCTENGSFKFSSLNYQCVISWRRQNFTMKIFRIFRMNIFRIYIEFCSSTS